MGLNVSVHSDLRVNENFVYPEGIRKKLRSKNFFLARRYFAFTEQYSWENENSVIFQLNKLLDVDILFLTKHCPWEGEGEFPKQYLFEIEEIVPKIERIILALSQPRKYTDEIDIEDLSLVHNTEAYTKYVNTGGFKQDLEIVLSAINFHKELGAKKMFFWI